MCSVAAAVVTLVAQKLMVKFVQVAPPLHIGFQTWPSKSAYKLTFRGGMLSGATLADTLQLEVHDMEVPVLTGIYSEETHLPQPLRISLTVDLDCPPHDPENPRPEDNVLEGADGEDGKPGARGGRTTETWA